MHITRRMVIVVALSLAIVPVATTGMLANLVRTAMRDDLLEAFGAVSARARRKGELSGAVTAGEHILAASRARTLALAREKRAVRMELKKKIVLLQGTHHVSSAWIQEKQRAASLLVEQESRLERFALLAYRGRSAFDVGPRESRSVLQKLMGLSLGDRVAFDIRAHALQSARGALIVALIGSRDTADLRTDETHGRSSALSDEIALLQWRLEKLRGQYLKELVVLDRAGAQIVLSERELQSIRREDAQVRQEIGRMRLELDRIDARIRAKTERKLLELGLRAPRPPEERKKHRGAQFQWPATGSISAGFSDAGYTLRFGIPHRAIDIVIPQRTPVFAASDGVVFLVRDGGVRGYTYVLIGHQDGYATLYGHLSEVTVAHGQDIDRGQMIGRSGGIPGTKGAGLMTTGAHLHFELIKDGTNIDPRTMLP